MRHGRKRKKGRGSGTDRHRRCAKETPWKKRPETGTQRTRREQARGQTEQQSEELVKYLLSEFENDPSGIWEANMFGKSLHSLVNEGLSGKLGAMPPDTQKKMRRALSRIVNEGKGGVLCVLL